MRTGVCVGGGGTVKRRRGEMPSGEGVRRVACRGQSWEKRQKDGFFSHVKPMVTSLALIFLKTVFLGLCLSQGSPNLSPGCKVPPPPSL